MAERNVDGLPFGSNTCGWVGRSSIEVDQVALGDVLRRDLAHRVLLQGGDVAAQEGGVGVSLDAGGDIDQVPGACANIEYLQQVHLRFLAKIPLKMSSSRLQGGRAPVSQGSTSTPWALVNLLVLVLVMYPTNFLTDKR